MRNLKYKSTKFFNQSPLQIRAEKVFILSVNFSALQINHLYLCCLSFKWKIMKQIVLGFFLLFIVSVQAQELNRVIIDPDLNREILVGWVDRAGISSKDYLGNEELKYEAYQVNKEEVAYLKNAFSADKNLRVLVVFGTWCGDSKANVPDFFKVAALAEISNVNYLAVNKKKKAENVDMSKMNIERVPTFIVYRGDIEIGRIIENPDSTLEADLVSILKK